MIFVCVLLLSFQGPFALSMAPGFFGFFAHTGALIALEDAGLLDGVRFCSFFSITREMKVLPALNYTECRAHDVMFFSIRVLLFKSYGSLMW